MRAKARDSQVAKVNKLQNHKMANLIRIASDFFIVRVAMEIRRMFSHFFRPSKSTRFRILYL